MPNIDLRPAALPIVVYYKGDVSMRFTFTSGGSTYPLTGASAAFVISEKNGTAALSLSGGSGLTINEAGGYIDLAITNAQIIALASQEYNYEFSITIIGNVWPIMDSVFIVSEDGQAEASASDITVSLDGTNVDVSVVAPAGSIGHTIQDEGINLPDRDYLNFTGAGVTVTDAGGKTVVTIHGGAGASDWGDIGGTLSDQTDLQTALDGKVDENAAIVGATKTKITYDAKGLVTAGADAAIADITGLQTALDSKAASSHTHPLSDLTQSGATLNQIPKWNGSAWVPADDETGGGGSVEIIDITYADMETALSGSTLTPGQFYRITDASGTDLGFICQAIRENEITVNGTGGYLNADFQAAGDYGNTPETFNAQLGIWRTSFEAVTIAYTNLSGGTFAVGDTITGGNTGATAVIVTDDGASSMEAYMTSQGTAFDGSEQLDNGNGVTADMDGAAGSPTIVLGDVVIWNLLHYQLTDDAALNGDNPENNTDAYTLLDKATYPETYVDVWDISEFDFANNWLQYRADKRGNRYRYTFLFDSTIGGPGISLITEFHFGDDTVFSNTIENSYLSDMMNTPYRLEQCSFFDGSYLTGCTFSGGSYLTGCTFSGESYLEDCTFSGESYLESCTFSGESYLTGCAFSGASSLIGCTFSGESYLESCTFSDESLFESCRFSGSGYLISCTFVDSGLEYCDFSFGLGITERSYASESVSSKILSPYGSTFAESLDITGLTAIDYTINFYAYVGVLNLTSSNATETIAADSLSNFPVKFPFRLVPASGLTITLTGTAAASATNGSIVMSGATIVLDGTNGDFVELEADSTETFVRVKNVQIYA